MKPIQLISQDLFDKIRSRFSNLEMGDETGAVTVDPSQARFFDFDFTVETVEMGRVSVSINDPGSLKIYYSQGITENKDTIVRSIWYDFLKEMRKFAMRRLLRFDTRDIAKSNLDKNDFQYLAKTQGNKEEQQMSGNLKESMWNAKNTKKTSRAVKGTTEVIVRHFKPVDEMFSGSRSRRSNIKAIYIQNKDGERYKYPFIHTAGALAMAQHVDHGGVPYDSAGKAIINMSEQIAQLQEFQKHIRRSTLHDDAMGITERACARLDELRMKIHSLGKSRYYENWIAEFDESNNQPMLSELDPVTFEDYKSKFTQSNFNEELGKLFPLIHSIMQETNKVDLEDYVKEEDNDDEDEDVQESAFDRFTEWVESVEPGKLDRSQIDAKLQGQDLLTALSDLTLGPDGTVAWGALSELFDLDERDSDDEELKNQLESAAQKGDNQDVKGVPLTIFKGWIESTFPEWKADLPELFQDTAEQPPAEPAPTTAPAAPTTAPAAPATPPVAEGMNQESMYKDIAETVKRFYNSANETVAPFRSEEAIAIEVEKTIAEKYGDKYKKPAGMLAKKFMEKLTRKWEEKHGKSADECGAAGPVDDDGLSRLKELVSNIKSKVEGMDCGVGEKDNKASDLPEMAKLKKLAGLK